MAVPNTDPALAAGGAWTHAPCMLLTVDPDGRILTTNPWFLRRTGYRADQVVGRLLWDELLSVGSRIFFQTQLAPVLELDRQLEEVMVDLRTATGGRLPALLNAKVRGDGEVDEIDVALMSVQDRRAFEDRLRRSRDDAEAAHEEAERARRDAERARLDTERALAAEAHVRLRLETLARANAALASSVDVDLVLRRLAPVVTAQLADWCVIYVLDRDRPDISVAFHADGDVRRKLERVVATTPLAAWEEFAMLESVEDGRPGTVRAIVTGAERDSLVADPVARELLEEVGLRSLMVVPAAASALHVATLILGRGEHREPFTAIDLADMTDLAARTGMVIANLHRQAREHSNSVALQHALLTTPPTGSSFEIATRYQPATNGNEVGGDWYDAVLTPEGTPILVIGDVVGHDIQAAASMGQLRGVLRTLAYTTPTDPADLLTRLDETARGLGVDVLATALVAQLETSSSGAVILHWSTAGHPPPLLVTQSGVRILAAQPDTLLGLPVALQHERHNYSHPLQSGDMIVLYTDGLVERTDETIDDSIARLVAALTSRPSSDPDDLCEAVLAARNGDTRDDVALLALRVE